LNTPHPTTEIHIRPNRSWVRIDWRELWEYRDLLYLLVRRDFVSKYKQTVLGPAWFILQPVLMSLMFTVVFGKIARLPTDGLPPYLFYLCGQLSWQYFATNMNATASTFTANAHLFGKVYFPRLAIPLATSFSNLIAFLIQFATFCAFWAYYKFTPEGPSFGLHVSLLLLPLVLLHVMALSLGVSLWMSSLSAKYRDFGLLMGFLTQLWMFATPIIYPLSGVPEKWRWLAELNPMAVIAEWFRLALLGQGSVGLESWALSLAITLVFFFTGLAIFQRTSRTFVDTV
jgi:lipopolysaccharide transport system permease protein